MNKDDFYLSILIGVISGLIVLFGQFVGETIQNTALKIGVTIMFTFIHRNLYNSAIICQKPPIRDGWHDFTRKS